MGKASDIKEIANNFCNLIKDIYPYRNKHFLHEPSFGELDKKYINKVIDSTFVSSVGKEIDAFEKKISSITGSYASVCVNGTSAIHASLFLSNVKNNDLVITQALTFIGTCNPIKYLGADPVFIDVEKETLGMCPLALDKWLSENAILKKNICIHKKSNRKIKVVMPVHIFGNPCNIKEIREISKKWNLILIEDSAESFGTFINNKHTGTYGKYGILSFNGNKIITTGGGGAILTKTFKDYKRVKHILTTAKIAHPYNYVHDEVGFNYRMPNINASLGLAQIEDFSEVLSKKKRLALMYKNFFKDTKIDFFEPINTNKQNNWLNTIIFSSKYERNLFMRVLIENDIFPRPPWKLMSEINFFKECFSDDLSNSRYLEERILNLPSSTIT